MSGAPLASQLPAHPPTHARVRLTATCHRHASLEENRPELDRAEGSDWTASAEAHARAARLLSLAEQSVVYGSKMVRDWPTNLAMPCPPCLS
mgnify:CR=1 FL=1